MKCHDSAPRTRALPDLRHTPYRFPDERFRESSGLPAAPRSYREASTMPVLTIPRRLVLVLLAAILVATPTVRAHHSFAATYRDDTVVTIEGELVQVMFRNPHSFVQLIVTEKNGAQVRYALEWRGAGQLE